MSIYVFAALAFAALGHADPIKGKDLTNDPKLQKCIDDAWENQLTLQNMLESMSAVNASDPDYSQTDFASMTAIKANLQPKMDQLNQWYTDYINAKVFGDTKEKRYLPLKNIMLQIEIISNELDMIPASDPLIAQDYKLKSEKVQGARHLLACYASVIFCYENDRCHF